MRLKSQDLSIHLQRGLSPLYFIVGEEPQQQLETLNKIRIKAQQEGYAERERYDISPQFDWENFKTELSALSLFSEKRFIEARLTGNIGKLGARVIVEIANNPPPNTLLVFSSEKLDSAVAKSAWFTAIERLAITLWPRPLSRQELASWITKRVKEVGLKLQEEALDALIERTEGNLLATDQAIEKLLLYSYSSKIDRVDLQNAMPEKGVPTDPKDSKDPKGLEDLKIPKDLKEITAAEIAEITSVDTQFSLFDLVDTALLGDIVRTKQIFTRLMSEGVEPILILWAITREVRAIIPLAESIDKGCSVAQGIREKNVWKHKVPIYTSFLKRSSLTSLHQIIIQAKDLDNLIKGRETGDVESALFSLCLNLAGACYA